MTVPQTTSRPSAFRGCLLGLALGDALGAPFEGGPIERALWLALGRTRQGKRRWTDDTQMSLDLADSLIDCGGLQPDDLASRFARSYRWSRGYGPGAARVLKRIRRGIPWQAASRSFYPGGSFGNGGAMRAPVIGLWHGTDRDSLLRDARASAEITHVHPLGQAGAVLIALATSQALEHQNGDESWTALRAEVSDDEFLLRFDSAQELLASDQPPTPQQVRRGLGNGMAATESCVTAIYLAQRFRERPLLELLGFAAQVGGDVDTLGAMAGALWGARRGDSELPADRLGELEQMARIRGTAQRLAELRGGPP